MWVLNSLNSFLSDFKKQINLIDLDFDKNQIETDG